MQGGDHAGADYMVGLEDKVVQNEHHGYRENNPTKDGAQDRLKAIGDITQSVLGLGRWLLRRCLPGQ